MSKAPPLFEHDCTRCEFIGTREYTGGPADVYVCPDYRTPRWSSVIARHSDDGPDYHSFPIMVLTLDPILHIGDTQEMHVSEFMSLGMSALAYAAGFLSHRHCAECHRSMIVMDESEELCGDCEEYLF